MAEGKAVWTKFDENVSVSNVLLGIFMSKAGDVRCYILPHFFLLFIFGDNARSRKSTVDLRARLLFDVPPGNDFVCFLFRFVVTTCA